MNPANRTQDYLILTAKMTLAVYVLGHMLILAHELAHGTAALLLGGYFPFFQIDADGGRSTFFFGPEAAPWRQALALLAGAGANTLISVFALAWVLGGIRNRELRFLAILTGGLSSLSLIVGSGLLPPWWARYKETGEAFTILGLAPVAQVLLKSVWIIIGILLALAFFRLFFRELMQQFPVSNYRSRFLLVTSALALPVMIVMAAMSVIMLSSGYGEGVITLSRHLPHIIFLLLTWALLPAVISSTEHAPQLLRVSVSRRQIALYALVAAAFAIAQPTVFGNDRVNPKGIFLTRPPEVQVASLNVVVIIHKDRHATVRWLMRPFVSQHDFLWERLKDLEPADWHAYEKFAAENLAPLIGIAAPAEFTHYSDAGARFFDGKWTSGARVVEAETDLSESAFFGEQNSFHVLKIVDFWNERHIGYIDFIEVRADAPMQITGVGVEPQGAAAPTSRSDNLIRWENSSVARTFTRAFVAFK